MTVLFFVPQSAGKQQIGNKHGSGNQQNPQQPATYKNMISIPIPIQNNVYPHTLFHFSHQKAYIISNICSPGFI